MTSWLKNSIIDLSLHRYADHWPHFHWPYVDGFEEDTFTESHLIRDRSNRHRRSVGGAIASLPWQCTFLTAWCKMFAWTEGDTQTVRLMHMNTCLPLRLCFIFLDLVNMWCYPYSVQFSPCHPSQYCAFSRMYCRWIVSGLAGCWVFLWFSVLCDFIWQHQRELTRREVISCTAAATSIRIAFLPVPTTVPWANPATTEAAMTLMKMMIGILSFPWLMDRPNSYNPFASSGKSRDAHVVRAVRVDFVSNEDEVRSSVSLTCDGLLMWPRNRFYDSLTEIVHSFFAWIDTWLEELFFLIQWLVCIHPLSIFDVFLCLDFLLLTSISISPFNRFEHLLVPVRACMDIFFGSLSNELTLTELVE